MTVLGGAFLPRMDPFSVAALEPITEVNISRVGEPWRGKLEPKLLVSGGNLEDEFGPAGGGVESVGRGEQGRAKGRGRHDSPIYDGSLEQNGRRRETLR